MILLKSSKSKYQVVHEQKFKDHLNSTCQVSVERIVLDLESEAAWVLLPQGVTFCHCIFSHSKASDVNFVNFVNLGKTRFLIAYISDIPSQKWYSQERKAKWDLRKFLLFMFSFQLLLLQATVVGGFVIEDVDEEECKGQGYEDPDTPAARELANDVAAMVTF